MFYAAHLESRGPRSIEALAEVEAHEFVATRLHCKHSLVAQIERFLRVEDVFTDYLSNKFQNGICYLGPAVFSSRDENRRFCSGQSVGKRTNSTDERLYHQDVVDGLLSFLKRSIYLQNDKLTLRLESSNQDRESG